MRLDSRKGRIGSTAAFVLALTWGLAAVAASSTDATVCLDRVVSQLGPIAITSDGQKLYVTDTLSPRVLVASTRSRTIRGTISLAGPARGIALDSVGSTVLVTTSLARSGELSMIDTTRDVVTHTIALGTGSYTDVVVTSDGETAYVLRTDSPSISQVDLTRRFVKKVVNAPAGASRIGLGSSGPLFVAGSKLWEIEMPGAHATTVAALHFIAGGIAVSPNSQIVALVPALSPNKVVLVDVLSKRVSAEIVVGVMPEQAAFAPDGRRIYVTNSLGGPGYVAERKPGSDTISSHILADLPTAVTVIDADHASVSKTIQVGLAAKYLALTRDGQRAYVTNFDDKGSAYISIIDTVSGHTDGRINTSTQSASPTEARTCKSPGGS